MKTITMKDFKQKYEVQKLNIIDVRSTEQYEAGHITGASHIPLEDLAQKQEGLDKTQTYYIVCQRGIKSQEATQFLEAQGFDVVNVEGGISAW